jgi:uncharacterized coiled-coil protein SlyX
MDALARLDEYLVQAIEAPTENQEKPKFRIETKEQAIWAMRKIAAIERGRQESRAAAQAEIERIQAWLAEEEKRADQAREYLDYLLEDYHRRQLEENPRAKTIKLPHGELQLRAQQPEFHRDETVVMAWAMKNRPEFVVQPPPPAPKLDWANLKKKIQVVDGKVIDSETGEVIPGITVVERPPKFQIKLSGV